VKPVVRRSINDESGQRCVDLVQSGDAAWHWQECRRDPEDAHGWRIVTRVPDASYGSLEEAARAAQDAIAWLAEEGMDDPDRT
tara:strand:- start:538 stop:786 length:249 start_codon:yes stop_codon:yes gene_type:complete